MIQFIRKTFCKHDYVLVNQFELPSEYDIVVESCYRPKTSCSLTRKMVSDYKCSECGDIKRKIVKTHH